MNNRPDHSSSAFAESEQEKHDKKIALYQAKNEALQHALDEGDNNQIEERLKSTRLLLAK